MTTPQTQSVPSEGRSEAGAIHLLGVTDFLVDLMKPMIKVHEHKKFCIKFQGTHGCLKVIHKLPSPYLEGLSEEF